MTERKRFANPKTKYIQGYYKPNPDKYIGKKNPIFRSAWELKYMKYCDVSSEIVAWCSESVGIRYYDPVRFKNRIYYPDFLIVLKDKSRVLVEIKPSRETKPPRDTVKKKRITLIYEQVTYKTNKAKWEAAQKYCDSKGWKFQIITEKQLNAYK